MFYRDFYAIFLKSCVIRRVYWVIRITDRHCCVHHSNHNSRVALSAVRRFPGPLMKNLKRYIHELSHAPVIFPRYWFRSHIHSINKFLRLPYLKNRAINLSPLLSPARRCARTRYTRFFAPARSHLSTCPCERASERAIARARSRTLDARKRDFPRSRASDSSTFGFRSFVFRSSNYLVTTVITIIARDVSAWGAKAINQRRRVMLGREPRDITYHIRFSLLERIVKNLLRTTWAAYWILIS